MKYRLCTVMSYKCMMVIGLPVVAVIDGVFLLKKEKR